MRQFGDKSREVFGNPVGRRAYRKACRAKKSYEQSCGDGAGACRLEAREAPVIGPALGVRRLLPAPDGAGAFDLRSDAAGARPVVIGTIRMGYGHYRIGMALASAAHALGYAPYLLDLMAFPATACTKIVSRQNDLYSLGSRLSQSIPLFNRLYWEPLNSEGFRKLAYNASDQKVAELMTEPFAGLPHDVPFVGAHAWPCQAALHAGFEHVVNAIPDNWPMALHLSEGAVHAVQTPSAFMGYKMLRGMDGKRRLKPMPAGSLELAGHYVDHEIVSNVAADCARRKARMEGGEPVRYLLTVGGAGAQRDLMADVIAHLAPLCESGDAALFVNFGDHAAVRDALVGRIPALAGATEHYDDHDEVAAFCEAALDGHAEGIHLFCNSDIFSAVYSTNLLMRCCDVLATKPSELAYYPVPKIMMKRVGGHEAWGAVRSAELGDGTFELGSAAEVCAFADLLQAERDVVCMMCDNIVHEAERGTYDGAYKVVKLAVS